MTFRPRISLAFVALLAACAPTASPEPAIHTQIIQITSESTRLVTVEVTRLVRVPVTVTPTPGPSSTPTVTDTPTRTPTPIPTITPFAVTGCQNLRSVPNYWNIDSSDAPDRLFPTYDALADKCVKFFASEGFGLVTTDFAWLTFFTNAKVAFAVDADTPPGITGVPKYSTVWGIWEVVQSGVYRVHLRRVEPLPDQRQPMEDDGAFLVGPDYDISAGQWKSLWPPGTIDNCYWARTNPDTGSIKDNHFGQAGVYTRLYDSDLFESDDCAPWVFVGP